MGIHFQFNCLSHQAMQLQGVPAPLQPVYPDGPAAAPERPTERPASMADSLATDEEGADVSVRAPADTEGENGESTLPGDAAQGPAEKDNAVGTIYIYIYIYTHINIYIYAYIYIYIYIYTSYTSLPVHIASALRLVAGLPPGTAASATWPALAAAGNDG